MYKVSFLNGDDELKTRGLRSLESTAKDIQTFMNAEDLEDAGELGSFYDYGLSIDYILPEGKDGGFLRYQLSWGGPSSEIRFYEGDFIEYVFLDWGVGVGFDVTNEDWAQWLKEWFEEIGAFEEEKERAEELQ